MKFLTSLTLFMVLLTAVGAQTTPKHRILVRVQAAPSEKYLLPLESLLTGDLGFFVVPSQVPAGAGSDEVLKEAKRFACDVVLDVAVSDASGKDRVVWRLSSPDEPLPRASGEVVKPRPDWAAAADLYWLFLTKPLAAQTGPLSRPWPAPAVAERGQFTIAARPGTLVTGLPSGSFLVDSTGQKNVSLDLPVSLFLQGHLSGWRTEPQRIFVDRPGQLTTLGQTLLPPWGVTASLNNFAFPSLGGEWSPGGSLVFRVQLDQFLGGLSLANQANATGLVLPVQSLPLMTLQLGAAWYWSWPEDKLRFYTALDWGTRWMFPQFKIFVLEPVVPMTIEPLAGWDYRWTTGQSVYFELGPTIEYAPDPLYFKASQKPNASNAQIQLSGPFFMEFPFKAKAGYRWTF